VEPATLETVCSACGKAAACKPTKTGAARLPRAWKRVGDAAYCPDCVTVLYRLRAVTLPARGGPLEGGTADELWAALRPAWDQCRMLANWATTEVAKRDRPRRPGETLEGKTFRKESPAPRPYLYPEAVRLFPDLPSQAVTAMLQASAQKYAARRYEVVWRFDSSLPTCRKAPLCLSAQAWRAEWREIEEEDDEGVVRRVRAAVVTFPLAGRRWAVRLRLGSGEHARRAGAAFAELVSGEAVRGELVLSWQRSSMGAHRSTRPMKEAGGGNAVRTRLAVKLVARFPRHEREGPARSGALAVCTARNALFVASAPGREWPWLLRADWLRGLVIAHKKAVQKIADDTKAERRRPRRRRVGMQGYLDTIARRYACRLKSGIEYVGIQLVGYADRTGCASIRLDDRDRRYCPDFAWAVLRETLTRQADDAGLTIEFADASGAAVEVGGGGETAKTDES
jgi:hypothetical protein